MFPARRTASECLRPARGARKHSDGGLEGGAAGSEVGADGLGDVEGEDLGTGFVEVEAVFSAHIFELVVARVNLASARRDEYVAAYTLLAAVGEAEAEPLGVPGARYDATTNARRVRGKWNDYDSDANPDPLPRPDPVSASRSVAIGPR